MFYQGTEKWSVALVIKNWILRKRNTYQTYINIEHIIITDGFEIQYILDVMNKV